MRARARFEWRCSPRVLGRYGRQAQTLSDHLKLALKYLGWKAGADRRGAAEGPEAVSAGPRYGARRPSVAGSGPSAATILLESKSVNYYPRDYS